MFSSPNLHRLNTRPVRRAGLLLALFLAGAFVNSPEAHGNPRTTGHMTEESLQGVYRAITSLGRKASLCDDVDRRQELIKKSLDTPELREITNANRWASAKKMCEILLAETQGTGDR